MMPLYITILYSVCGILMLLLSVLVFLKDSRSPVNQMFSAFGVSVVLWIAFLYLGFYFATAGNLEASFAFGRLTYGASIWFPLFLTLFFYQFPKKTFTFSRFSKFLLFFTSATLFILVVFTPLIHESQIIEENFWIADTFGKYYWAYLLYTIFHLCLVSGIAIQKILNTRGIEQTKTIIASTGLFFFSIIALLTNVILPNFNVFILQTESVTFSLLFLIPAFYSIQKYRFFDFSYVSLSIVRYTILVVAFAGTNYVLYQLLQSNLSEEFSIPAQIMSSLLALFLFIKLERIFPEFISNNFREFRYKMDELKSNIYYTKNYTELIQKLEKTFILDLHLNSVQLYLIRSKKNHIEVPIYYKDLFTEEIEKNGIKLLVTEEITLQKQAILLAHLKKLNAAVCVPLYLEKRLIGLLVIGEKTDDTIFSLEEIEEIMKTKQYIELCFINILLQSDLKEENDYMKQMINQKTKSLKRQNEKIKKIVNQQSDFIAVTAHEFRTPLNIALLQLEDTLESYEHSSHVLEDMKTLESSLDKLKHLTQNLFDVQQYDLKKVRVYEKEIDLNWFITDINEEFQDISRKKNRKLILQNRLKEKCPVSIDEPKLRQVMHNLLTNALKFTSEDGTIIIKAEEKESTVSLSVIDDGEGVPENTKKKIFEKFQTNHSHMGMGIGMGLYLCKRIIDLHKGKIVVTDTPGGGATFTIELPKQPEVKKPHIRVRKTSTLRK